MQYSAFARAVLQFYDKFVASVICHIEGIFLTINVTKLSQKGHIGPVRTAMQRNATAMRRMIVPMFVCALGAASPAMASEDTQHWETLTLNVALPDSFKLQSETVARTGDAKGFYEIEENVMVGKKLNKTVTVWLGYTFNPTYSHGTFQRREHRFRQQVNFDNVLVLGKAKYIVTLSNAVGKFEEMKDIPITRVAVDGAGNATFSVGAFAAAAIHVGAKLAGGPPPSTVAVTFTEVADTFFGQNIYVVGDLAALGAWNTGAAVPLTWISGSGTTGTWRTTINLPASTAVQYKYIKKDGAGAVTWESGANRALTTGAGGTRLPRRIDTHNTLPRQELRQAS